MKETAVLGIDPGVKGTLCLLAYPQVAFYDYQSIFSANFDLRGINRRFDVKFAILEKVWFWKNEKDVKSAEVLIRNSQTWATLLEINMIPFIQAAPATWRKGLVKKGKKNAMTKAHKLFPGYKDLINRHDRAEAALIAYRAHKHVEAGFPTTTINQGVIK